LIAAILILAWVPPVSRDALTHHLAVPKLYLQHGGMYEIPSVPFSYYPMNLDLLYCLPLYFGNDVVPKYIHFIFALLTASLIFFHLKDRLNTRFGLCGVLLFLSLPVIIKLSITVYVDLGLIFFSTAALIFLLKWIEHDWRTPYLILSAIFCGLCMGTKYNGLITFFLLGFFVPFVYARESRNSGAPSRGRASMRAIGFGVLFAVVSLAVLSPWMVRNYLWTKNPLYPLYESVFRTDRETTQTGSPANPGDTGALEDEENSRQPFGHFMIRRYIYHEPLWWTLLMPVRIFFQGEDDNPKLFDGRLNPYLFFLPLIAFLWIRQAPGIQKIDTQILLAFSILYFLIAFFKIDMRIRYISPIIPPLVILSVYGLHRLVELYQRLPHGAIRRAAGVLVSCGLMCLLTLNGLYVVDLFRRVQPLAYLSGHVTRDDYIQQRRPEYAVLQYANRHTPETSRILGLFLGNRLYYSDRELCFGNNLLLEIARRAGSAEDISSELKKKGFTHIIIGYSLFDKWYGRQLDKADKQILQSFFEHSAKHLVSLDGHGLFAL
jgi:4-amino-4-deoxy-L-arabinose transferase-like glycosyltransferase